MIYDPIHRYYVHDPRVTLCKSNLSLGKFRHAIGVVHWQQKEKKIVFFILCAHQQNWQPTLLWGVVFCLLCSKFLIILLCSCGHPHSHFHRQFYFFFSSFLQLNTTSSPKHLFFRALSQNKYKLKSFWSFGVRTNFEIWCLLNISRLLK